MNFREDWAVSVIHGYPSDTRPMVKIRHRTPMSMHAGCNLVWRVGRRQSLLSDFVHTLNDTCRDTFRTRMEVVVCIKF